MMNQLSLQQKASKLAKIRGLVREGKDNGEIIKALEPEYGKIDRNTVIYQKRNIDSVKRPGGRKRSLPDEVVEHARMKIQQSSSAHTTAEIVGFLRDGIVEYRKKNKLNEHVIIKVGDRTLRDIARKLAPATESKPTIQSIEREKVINDLNTGISQAIMTHGIQGIQPTVEGKLPSDCHLRIHPSNTFNFDTLSCIINGEIIEKVRLPHELKKKLKEKKLAVNKVAQRTQRRAVKQIYVTSAAGFLNVGVVIIKDRNIKIMEFHKLVTQGGYELWVVFSPKVNNI